MRIGRAALAAFLLLGATGAAAQAPATASMVPLRVAVPVSPETEEQRSAVYCVATRDFCLRAWREGQDDGHWFLDLHQRVPSGVAVTPVGRIALPAGEDPSRETHTIWPHLIREASGALLFGVLRTRTAGFSGGGAGETQLILLRQLPGAIEASEVLTVQTGYSAMIRACFTEAEYRTRGACHDEYELDGVLSLAAGAGGERPSLILTVAARSFPRGARREDSETRRLRRSDLVWEADPECSYRRSFAFSAASGRYEPNRPLPECTTYRLP